MVHDARSREIDTNGQVRRGAIELAIHEVRTATEEKPKGYTTGDEIGQGEEGDVIDLRVDETRDDYADETPVKGHAPVGKGEDLEGMGEVIAIPVDKAIAESRPDDDAKSAVADEDERVVTGKAQLPVLGVEIHDESRTEKAHDIGKPIPSHGKRPDGKENRINRMVKLVKHVRHTSMKAPFAHTSLLMSSICSTTVAPHDGEEQ